MSLLHRLARPAVRPVGRAYSSFFSSKPGGGKHFVSAKPPKPVDTSPDLSASAAKADETRSPQSLPPLPLDRPPVHPTLSSKEYRLHQFFSLHRPLLLLNQSTSAIFDVADPSTLPSSSSQRQLNDDTHHSFSTIDNPPESSPEADADAARQLAHTLVMNRVGSAIAWQQALSRLGLTTDNFDHDVSLAKETAQEWVTIHADSTRRKKRKKMKKHKLKKRRRLTRHQSK